MFTNLCRSSLKDAYLRRGFIFFLCDLKVSFSLDHLLQKFSLKVGNKMIFISTMVTFKLMCNSGTPFICKLIVVGKAPSFSLSIKPLYFFSGLALLECLFGLFTLSALLSYPYSACGFTVVGAGYLYFSI